MSHSRISDVCNVYVHTISGLDPIILTADKDTLVSDLLHQIFDRLPESVAKRCSVSFNSGRHLGPEYRKLSLGRLKQQLPTLDNTLELRLNPALCGGKGGFGSMLKSQGGRMAKRKGKRDESKDNWKTSVDGLSVRDLRRAKELADRMGNLPETKKTALEAKKAKLQAIIDQDSRSAGSSSVQASGTAALIEESENLAAEVGQTVNSVLKDRKRVDAGPPVALTKAKAQPSPPDEYRHALKVKKLQGFFESEPESESESES